MYPFPGVSPDDAAYPVFEMIRQQSNTPAPPRGFMVVLGEILFAVGCACGLLMGL